MQILHQQQQQKRSLYMQHDRPDILLILNFMHLKKKYWRILFWIHE